MKEEARGIKRVIKAGIVSYAGLKATFLEEEAFRMEVFLITPLLVATYLVPGSFEHKLIVVLAAVLVLVAELLNTGIEAIVDKASPEINSLAKKAKDCGSAAVLLSLIFLGGAFLTLLY